MFKIISFVLFLTSIFSCEKKLETNFKEEPKTEEKLENVGCKYSSILNNDDFHANSGCIILNDKNQVLVMVDPLSGKFDVPKIDPKEKETAKCTAYRSVQEQLGADIFVEKSVFQIATFFGEKFSLYICKLNSNENQFVNKDGKHIPTKWIDIRMAERNDFIPEFFVFFDKIKGLILESIKNGEKI